MSQAEARTSAELVLEAAEELHSMEPLPEKRSDSTQGSSRESLTTA